MLRAFAGAFVVRGRAGALVGAAALAAFVAFCPVPELTRVRSAVQHAPMSFNLSLLMLLHFLTLKHGRFWTKSLTFAPRHGNDELQLSRGRNLPTSPLPAGPVHPAVGRSANDTSALVSCRFRSPNILRRCE